MVVFTLLAFFLLSILSKIKVKIKKKFFCPSTGQSEYVSPYQNIETIKTPSFLFTIMTVQI